VDFRTTLLGGGFTREKTGEVYDAHSGQAANQGSKNFCQQYGMAKSARFAKTLGGQTAALLARSWCHRAQYYYTIYMERGPGYVFQPADHHAYEEPQELIDAYKGMDHRAKQRVEQIRAWRPTVGGIEP